MCESGEAASEEMCKTDILCLSQKRTSTFPVHHNRTRTLPVTGKLRNEVKEKKERKKKKKKKKEKNMFIGEETQVILKLDERSSISVTKNSRLL